MINFFKLISLIKSHRETIDAIIYRELKLKLLNSRFGFLGILFKQIAQIVIFLLIFTLIRNRAVPAMDPKLFLATGFITYQIFLDIGLKSSLILKKYSGLFIYKKIRPFDIIIATTFVNLAFELINLSIILGGIFLINQEIVLSNFPLLIVSTLFLTIFSFGLGNILIVLSRLYPIISDEFLSLMFRPIFLISGVIFSLDRIPTNLHKFLTWNPILQAIELNRFSLTNEYFLYDGISFSYLAVTSILVFILGIFIYSRNHEFLISKGLSS